MPRHVKKIENSITYPFKGQVYHKIEIFSFVDLPLPNTKKNHPKWDLGKDFFLLSFIER